MQGANSRSSRFPRFRAGVDVGGTFTDVLIHDETTGSFTVSKTLTTPDDPSNGIVTALTACLTQAGVGPGALERLIHGTTLVTNALILRTGAPTGLVTTRGFRDVLDIAREH